MMQVTYQRENRWPKAKVERKTYGDPNRSIKSQSSSYTTMPAGSRTELNQREAMGEVSH